MSTRLQAEQARLLDMKRERDEARAEVERLRESRAYIAEKYEQAEAERDEAEAQRDALLGLLRGEDMDTVLRIAEGYLYGNPPTKPDPIVRPAAARIREALAGLEEA